MPLKDWNIAYVKVTTPNGLSAIALLMISLVHLHSSSFPACIISHFCSMHLDSHSPKGLLKRCSPWLLSVFLSATLYPLKLITDTPSVYLILSAPHQTLEQCSNLWMTPTHSNPPPNAPGLRTLSGDWTADGLPRLWLCFASKNAIGSLVLFEQRRTALPSLKHPNWRKEFLFANVTKFFISHNSI